MPFRFYSNWVSQVSRNAATAIFIVGLLLIGFGVVIIAFPELFAALAARIFFIAGLGCSVTAVKIYLAHRRFNKLTSDHSDDYRKNVQLHIEEREEF